MGEKITVSNSIFYVTSLLLLYLKYLDFAIKSKEFKKVRTSYPPMGFHILLW